MNLTIKRSGELEPMLLTVPDDYRVDEFYCTYNKIPDEISDSVVHERMKKSKDYLCDTNGCFIVFKDYANSITTLKELGIDGSNEYFYLSNYFRY